MGGTMEIISMLWGFSWRAFAVFTVIVYALGTIYCIRRMRTPTRYESRGFTATDDDQAPTKNALYLPSDWVYKTP